MFQEDYPEDIQDFRKDKFPVRAERVPANSFRVLRVTPQSLDLVKEVINTSADFDRAMKEGCESALVAYGDLVKARGNLVQYIARLMDRVGSPALNKQRTSQVRYE